MTSTQLRRRVLSIGLGAAMVVAALGAAAAPASASDRYDCFQNPDGLFCGLDPDGGFGFILPPPPSPVAPIG